MRRPDSTARWWFTRDRVHPVLPGLVLLGLMAAVGAGWFVYRLIHPVVDSEVLSDCDLQAGPCIVELAGQGRIRLEIGPRPFVPLTPLVVKAEIRGLVPESVALDLVGIDMYMGYNRPRLEPAGDGRYVGQLVIPVCSSRAMNWQARLLVRTGQGLVAAPFHFRTDAS